MLMGFARIAKRNATCVRHENGLAAGDVDVVRRSQKKMQTHYEKHKTHHGTKYNALLHGLILPFQMHAPRGQPCRTVGEVLFNIFIDRWP